MSKSPAIFLDRDGTMNEAVGYVNHSSRFSLFPWTVSAVRTIKEAGYLAVVVTNQSGVGRGYFSESLLDEVHHSLRSTLKEGGAELDGLYACLHGPEDACGCRKPKPGMLLEAAEDLEIDLTRSWMVGDTYRDLEAGWNAGARAALVRTGSDEGSFLYDHETWPRQPDLVGPDLQRVVCAILWGALD
jgi:D-glycero-D-manno-heptose 1,7-bisphosphate phosphatase